MVVLANAPYDEVANTKMVSTGDEIVNIEALNAGIDSAKQVFMQIGNQHKEFLAQVVELIDEVDKIWILKIFVPQLRNLKSECDKKIQKGIQILKESGDWVRKAADDLFDNMISENMSSEEKLNVLRKYQADASKIKEMGNEGSDNLQKLLDFIHEMEKYIDNHIVELQQANKNRLIEIKNRIQVIDTLVPQLQDQLQKMQNTRKGGCATTVVGAVFLFVPGLQAIGVGMVAGGAIVGFQAASTIDGLLKQISDLQHEKTDLITERTRIENGTTKNDQLVKTWTTVRNNLTSFYEFVFGIKQLWDYINLQLGHTIEEFQRAENFVDPAFFSVLKREISLTKLYYYKIAEVFDAYTSVF